MLKNISIRILIILVFIPNQESGAQIEFLNFFSLSMKDGLSDNRVTSIVKDNEDFMWIGTENGLNRYDGHEFLVFMEGSDSTALQENRIKTLFKSSTGEIWIGTYTQGLSKYIPGNEIFKRFDFNKSGFLPGSNVINSIAEDSDSVLFVATMTGLFYKNVNDEEFSLMPIIPDSLVNQPDKNKGILNRDVLAVTEDENKGIWVSYADMRFSYINLDEDVFHHYSLQEFNNDNRQTMLFAIHHHKGKLWMGGLAPGIIVFDPSDGSSELFLGDENLVSVNQIIDLSDTLVWIVTGSGLFNIDPRTGEYYKFASNDFDNMSLTTSPVTTCFLDEYGLMWVGTFNSGINYAILNTPFRHISVLKDVYFNLQEPNVSALMFDRNGDMWMGYNSGLLEFHDYLRQEKRQIPINSLFGNYSPGSIFCFFEDSYGDIYCGSWEGGLQKYDRREQCFIPVGGSPEEYKKLFNGTDIRAINEDDQGRLWFTIHGKGVYSYDKKTGKVLSFHNRESDPESLSNNWVFDLDIDSEGYAWVGSAWGLSKISTKDLSVKQYLNTSDSLSISLNMVQLVYVDQNDNIWLGSDYGLNYYDRDRKVFYDFWHIKSLNNIQIKSIIQDKEGLFWIGTSSGILNFRLIMDNGVPDIADLHVFKKFDGLQSESFNMKAIDIDSDGLIFLGGLDGVDFFNPERVKPLVSDPHLKITAIKIFGKKVFPGFEGNPSTHRGGEIILNHRQNMIGIDFVAISYSNDKDFLYSYKFSPLVTEWTSIGKDKNLAFSNLKPGHYNVSLKVNSALYAERTIENILVFDIRPAFWQTRIFKTTIFFLFLLTAFYTIRVYTNRFKRRQEQLEKLVRQRTRELHDKNLQLQDNSANLKKINLLLKERQLKIEEQSSEIKAQSEYLAETNKDLELLNSTKDKFFSIIAHDLKNPFSTVLGFTELYKMQYDTYDDKKRKELIEYIHSSVKQIFNLLENLLQWSRSQLGRIDIKEEILLLKKEIESGRELLRMNYESKQINFEVDVDEYITVKADRELMNTVLRNLVSNAIKFTPEKGNIKITAGKADRKMIRVDISDTGVGMTKKEIESVFRIESRISKKGTEGETGTGLGMIVCKEFIEKIGGKISIKSQPGEGTTVSLLLPEAI